MQDTTRPNQHPLALVRELIDQAITHQDWVAGFAQIHRIVQTARDDRTKLIAFRLLCDYRFGKPNATAPREQPPASHAPITTQPAPSRVVPNSAAIRTPHPPARPHPTAATLHHKITPHLLQQISTYLQTAERFTFQRRTLSLNPTG